MVIHCTSWLFLVGPCQVLTRERWRSAKNARDGFKPRPALGQRSVLFFGQKTLDRLQVGRHLLSLADREYQHDQYIILNGVD